VLKSLILHPPQKKIGGFSTPDFVILEGNFPTKEQIPDSLKLRKLASLLATTPLHIFRYLFGDNNI